MVAGHFSFFFPFIFFGDGVGGVFKEKNYPAQPEKVCPQESVCPIDLPVEISFEGH